MRKLLIAIVLGALAAGSVVTPLSAETLSKAEKSRLIIKGAKLWGVYCNQCHNARPPGEKAPYEWDQEIMHMRTLGNIPADDARALVQYLKAR
jgi:cytochrome c5